MVTMLLGGLWHGAGWTFVLWGGLHGAYLAVHQAWRYFGPRIPGYRSICGLIPARLLTFVSVVFGWVLFRAEDLPSAVALMRAMVGLEGLSLPQSLVIRGVVDGAWLARIGVEVSEVSLRPAVLFVLCCLGLLADRQEFLYYEF